VQQNLQPGARTRIAGPDSLSPWPGRGEFGRLSDETLPWPKIQVLQLLSLAGSGGADRRFLFGVVRGVENFDITGNPETKFSSYEIAQ